MNSMIRYLGIAAFAAVFVLAGCDQPVDDPSTIDIDTTSLEQDTVYANGTAAEGADAVRAQVHDGVQEARITVRNDGYEPNRIELQQGVPTRLVFVQESTSPCAAEVQIPAFDIEKTPLSRDEETVVEFTPDESGDFSFVCGMEMLSGTLLVRS